MSDADARTKLFKETAESPLSEVMREKEMKKLRSYLFKNQEYRFTKSAQTFLFMAVMGHYNHYCNAQRDADAAGDNTDSHIVSLLDDALKMPFNVFSSSQKSKLLSCYYSLLGKDDQGSSPNPASGEEKEFVLLDIVKTNGEVQLILMNASDGEEYENNPVTCANESLSSEIEEAFNDADEIVVVVQEPAEGRPICVKFHASRD